MSLLTAGDQIVEETSVYADRMVTYDSDIQWLYSRSTSRLPPRYQSDKPHYITADHQGMRREIFIEAGQASCAGWLNTWGTSSFGGYKTSQQIMTPIIPSVIFVLQACTKIVSPAYIITAFGTRG